MHLRFLSHVDCVHHFLLGPVCSLLLCGLVNVNYKTLNKHRAASFDNAVRSMVRQPTGQLSMPRWSKEEIFTVSHTFYKSDNPRMSMRWDDPNRTMREPKPTTEPKRNRTTSRIPTVPRICCFRAFEYMSLSFLFFLFTDQPPSLNLVLFGNTFFDKNQIDKLQSYSVRLWHYLKY